jgi:hypothetical protein
LIATANVPPPLLIEVTVNFTAFASDGFGGSRRTMMSDQFGVVAVIFDASAPPSSVAMIDALPLPSSVSASELTASEHSPAAPRVGGD